MPPCGSGAGGEGLRDGTGHAECAVPAPDVDQHEIVGLVHHREDDRLGPAGERTEDKE